MNILIFSYIKNNCKIIRKNFIFILEYEMLENIVTIFTQFSSDHLRFKIQSLDYHHSENSVNRYPYVLRYKGLIRCICLQGD